jgi:hypothetical protein
MLNLRDYSAKELSLHVFNDEYFYNELSDPRYVLALVDEEFHYTPEQMADLVQSIEEHTAEMAK